jgi:hypothetical protein
MELKTKCNLCHHLPTSGPSFTPCCTYSPSYSIWPDCACMNNSLCSKKNKNSSYSSLDKFTVEAYVSILRCVQDSSVSSIEHLLRDPIIVSLRASDRDESVTEQCLCSYICISLFCQRNIYRGYKQTIGLLPSFN